MKKWVEVNPGWLLRPAQDGLELFRYEENISLDLEDPLIERAVLADILNGQKDVTELLGSVEFTNVIDVLDDLEGKGVIRFTDHQLPLLPKLSDIQETNWKLRKHLVGSRGPVTSVYWLEPAQSQFAPTTQFFKALHLLRDGDNGQPTVEWSTGADRDVDLAELKAVMEATERYSMSVIPSEELIRTSARKLGEAAIDPRRVVSYSRRQYENGLPLIPYARDREYYWKEVTVLPEDTKCYLPAECVYCPVTSNFSPNLYTLTSSSGVAAGLSFEDSLLRGLYEAIERDAFMLTWINRFVMPKIDSLSLADDERERVAKLEALGYAVHLVNITLDLCPVVLAAAVSTDQQPALILGSSSNSSLVLAASKALTEIEQQMYWCMRNDITPRSIIDPKQVDSVMGHLEIYTTQKHVTKARFLWEGESQDLTSFRHQEYNEDIDLVGYLASKGFEVVTANLAPLELESTGIKVVRTIPLGLVPISFGYGMEPLGMSRIVETPRKVGIQPHRWQNNRPFPHPFP